MSEVWKFPIQAPGGPFTIDAPGPASPLHVGPDPSGYPSVWVRVDPEAENRS